MNFSHFLGIFLHELSSLRKIVLCLLRPGQTHIIIDENDRLMECDRVQNMTIALAEYRDTPARNHLAAMSHMLVRFSIETVVRTFISWGTQVADD